ncbi:MAG TPA: alpha/beta fold hydrolase [Oscillatoriaceae cyanobacterium]
MTETPVAFAVAGQTVRGMLHTPAGEDPVPAVLWLHGFTGNRNESHRLFVDGARRLAARGIASLRFDFRGCGESDGDFFDTSITSQIEDARAALAFLRSQPRLDAKRLAIAGFSLGTAIASQIASEESPAALVFWSPVVFPVPIFARLGLYAAHPELSRQGWIDSNGYRVGRDFLSELTALDPLGALAGWTHPLLVLYGKEDLLATTENAEALLAEIPGAVGEARAHAGHVFGSVPARSWLLERTESWLSEQLLGVPAR